MNSKNWFIFLKKLSSTFKCRSVDSRNQSTLFKNDQSYTCLADNQALAEFHPPATRGSNTEFAMID